MRPRRRAEFAAWAISIAAHACVIGYVTWRTSAPELPFVFELPMEIELGMTDALTVTEGTAPSAPESPPPQAAPPAAGGVGPYGADAGVPIPDADLPNAGERRVRPRRDAGRPEVAERDEGEDSAGDGGEGGGGEGRDNRGVAFLPAGSQIALRLDVARVRASALAADVRQLLAAMPDWRALLEGSGIDPLDDVDRLLVASPNLDRSRLVAAGRAAAGRASIRAAAEQLAAEQGESLEWRQTRGVPVADWHDRDETPRVVALVGPRHFVIAREADLPRVLAVAHARAARGGEGDAHEQRGRPREHPADALLSMQDGEGLSLEVEGFRNFARARGRQRAPLDVLPTRLRVGLSELPDGRVGARIVAHYDDGAQATAAVAYWDRMREAYARNVVTAFLGLSPILTRLALAAENDELRASVDLEIDEMRRLLGLVRGFFEDRARARASTPAGAPSAPVPPPSPSDELTPPPSPYEP